MGEWDATTYEGKDTILRVVRQEANALFEMIDDPAVWERDTACTRWTTRDVVGHLVDTIEGYFAAFDAARANKDPGTPHGLAAMSQVAGDRAIGFRDQTREQMIDRLHTDFDKVMELLDGVGPDDWGGLIVTHPYMGPVPAFIYAAGQLMDFGVHSWDIREGSGMAHALSGEAADLLVPFMFIIWQYTIKSDADMSPFEIGIRVLGGHNAGETPGEHLARGHELRAGHTRRCRVRTRVRRGRHGVEGVRTVQHGHRPRRRSHCRPVPQPVLPI